MFMRSFHLLVLCLLLTGCADSTKIDQMEAEMARLSAEVQYEQQQTAALQKRLTELAAQAVDLSQELEQIRKALAQLREAYPVSTRCVLDDIGLAGAMTSVLSDKLSEQLAGLIRAGVCLVNAQTPDYALVKDRLLGLQPAFKQVQTELNQVQQEQAAVQDRLKQLVSQSVIDKNTTQIQALSAAKACELDAFCRLKTAFNH